MALNFNTGGSCAYIRFMPSVGAWMLDGEEIDLKQCIFDLDNIATGWGKFEPNVSPEWVMDDDLEHSAPKPDGDNWKRGFQVKLFSKSTFNDEPVREFATTGTGPQMGIQVLYAQYEKEIADNQGKVPVVEYSGSVPTKIGKGNTRIPTLRIVKWTTRPAELSGGASASHVTSSALDEIGDEF